MKDLEFENIKKNNNKFKLTRNPSLYKFEHYNSLEIIDIIIPSDEILHINPYSIEIKFINHAYNQDIKTICNYNIYGNHISYNKNYLHVGYQISYNDLYPIPPRIVFK